MRISVILLMFLMLMATSVSAEERIWFTGGSLILEAGKFTNTDAPALALNKDATYFDGNFGISLDVLKFFDGFLYYSGATTFCYADRNKYQSTTAYSTNGIWGDEIGYRHSLGKANDLLGIGELYYKSQHAANPFSLSDTKIYDTYFIGYRFTMRGGSQYYK